VQNGNDRTPVIQRERRRRESSGSLRENVEALQTELSAARSGREYDSGRLRNAVASVAKVARQEYVPPERVLVLLKRLANDRALGQLTDYWRAVLTDRFVRWGIEAYYGMDVDD
jgi:hypothetical protein